MGTFGIHIEGYHPIWWKDEASHNDGGGPFIISRLDGPINVRDPNGKDVIVYLECDDVRPPNLPPYPNNRTNR
jgi:hypothetical protein